MTALVEVPDLVDLPTAPIAPPPSDVWVELPEVTEAPKKARRPRSRGRKVEDEAGTEVAVEAVAEAAAEAVVEPVAELAPVIEAPVVVEAAPEPVAMPEPVTVEAPQAPEPQALAEIEATPEAVEAALHPAEILAPPEKPKRGWWRRG